MFVSMPFVPNATLMSAMRIRPSLVLPVLSAIYCLLTLLFFRSHSSQALNALYALRLNTAN